MNYKKKKNFLMVFQQCGAQERGRESTIMAVIKSQVVEEEHGEEGDEGSVEECRLAGL